MGPDATTPGRVAPVRRPPVPRGRAARGGAAALRLGVLVGRDLVHGYRAWTALLVSVCGMGTVFALTLALLLVGARATGEAQAAYVTVSAVALGFSALTGVANLAQVSRVAVGLRRRAVALWQLAGVQPREAAAMTLTQVCAVCLLGGALAAALAPAVWGPFAAFVRSTDLPPAPGLATALPAAATAWAVVASVLVGALGGVPGARAAARQDVLDGLTPARSATAARAGRTRVAARVVLVAAGAAVVAALDAAISRVGPRRPDELGDFLTIYPGMGLLLLAVVAVAGGWFTSAFAWVAVRLTPAGRAPLPVYLATRQAASRLDHTRGLVMPVALCAAVTGIVLAWIRQLTAALRDAGAPDAVQAPGDQLALLVGGAVVIALVTSSSVSYASLDVRTRDAALLAAMGARPGTLYRQAVAEALVHAAMAAALAYGVIGLHDRTLSAALAHGPVPTASPGALPWEPLVLVAASFVLNTATLLGLTAHAVGRDPVATVTRSTA